MAKRNKRRAFFTSDPHFSHFNVIKYCNRPFASVEEMDAKLIADWNKVVTKNDDVYVTGDFCMMGVKSILEVMDILNQLNGTIHLVFGNHDHKNMWYAIEKLMAGKVVILGDMAEIKVEGQHIVLCHYSLRTWNRSHYKSWHLFGHSHNTLEGTGLSMDCGVDAKYANLYNWAPWSFEEISAVMENKTANLDGREEE